MSHVVQFGLVPPVSSDPPRVIAPQRASLFAQRARRFQSLAEGHVLGDWLGFLGRLSLAQHEALAGLGPLPLPDEAAMTRAHSHHMPLLPARQWSRDPAWRRVLAQLVTTLGQHGPEAVQASCRQLAAADPATLEALADRVLDLELEGPQASLLPYVAAALQVYWTALAAELGAEAMPALDVPGVCPCCGSLPVASVVRTAREVDKLRYLHCSLCNTEWHLVRVKCAACDANAHIAYRHIEGSSLPNADAMRAETCDDCMSYLKILYQDLAPEGDPVADDLATLALDLLADAAGYARAGPNLLFVPGSS
ncbi:MAG TPA: formate dehydrogenase accessory protein FdhE [Azospira sp.]|nr:formate dehydrogenase accessory protein FdhE [Azospira sp.]